MTWRLPSVLLFAISAAMSPRVQTGIVAGVIIDDRTQQPIRGVQVYVQNQSATTETDAAGRFTLTLSRGRQTITASMIGYALLQVDVEVGDVPLDLTLRLLEGAGAHTERVTVAGSLRSEFDSVPAATSLHGRELETLRGAVLDDPIRAIQSLPSTTATDDFYSDFAVRGDPFRYVGLVVDGVPTRYLMHALNGITDGGSIAMINSETLSSITLLPGSYPQRTGRRAGGELDLSTREGRRDRFHGRAGLSGTSVTFLGEGPTFKGKGSWLASARRSYLGYLIDRIDPETGFSFRFIDAQAKVVYDFNPRHQVSMLALAGRATFEEGDPNIGANEIGSATSNAWLTSLSWRYLPTPRFAATQRFYSTGLRYDNRNRTGAQLRSAEFSELAWRVDALFSPSARVIAEFGGDIQRIDGQSTSVRQLSGTNSQVTLNRYHERAPAGSSYGQVRFGPAASVSVTSGARIDYWGATRRTSASPWVNAELRPYDHTRVRAGGGLYRQFPELDEVHGLHGGGRGLQPESALHLDVGIEQLLPHETRILFNAYRRREQNMLWTPGAEPKRLSNGAIYPGSIDAPWVNVLGGVAQGLEVVVRRSATGAFSGWVGYAFGRLEYTDSVTGEQFWADADQRHTLTLFGSYRFSSRTSMSARYRYGSNFPIVGYIGGASRALGVPTVTDGQPLFYGLDDERNTLRLPAYSRLDVRADRAFNVSKRRLLVFVEVANVFNHKNLRNAAYSVDRAGRVFETTESLLPIVPSGGVVFEF